MMRIVQGNQIRCFHVMRTSGLCVALMGLLTGCATQRGVHEIPMARDYEQLEAFSLDEAERFIEKAHRMGAQHYAPYYYFSAVNYLELAREAKSRFDRKGAWDYAALAAEYAEQAIRDETLKADPGPRKLPANEEAAREEFAQLKARYLEIERPVAVQVAPSLYAHLTAELSAAEHGMNRGKWKEAARRFEPIEADIETIHAQDVDGDGIPDLEDLAPRQPEDVDGFQDEDGVPDPDNDQDGIPDVVDVAPNDPETKNRWHDYDGAPDEYPELDTIYFASGSATLDAESKGYLRGITELLHEWPDLKLHVRGYTDTRLSDRYNLDLSKRRAEAVHRYLLNVGAPADQLLVSYYGESMPGEQQEPAENRRVELVFE